MINSQVIEKEFEKSVKNKFNVYNSLFLNLPFRKVSNTGALIPLMQQVFKEGLESGKDPEEILESFMRINAKIDSEEEKIDFLFRVIQYVERQIVLYDSVEDAAFGHLVKLEDHLTLKDYFNLAETKKETVNLTERLSNFGVRIVFTAHPTQFYSPPVLDIISRLRVLILENKIDDIDIMLQQLGLTSLVNTKKPTPFDEAKNVIYFMKNIYYDALGELYEEIINSVKDENFDNPGIIQLGFWPGGDRDGNPFVTHETTNAVADELRMTLMKCYYKDIKDLERKLTFRGIEEIIDALRSDLYVSMFDPVKRLAYEDIVNPLLKVREILTEKYNSLFMEDLQRLINKVRIFKIHFAALDIRQNHAVHRISIERILKKEGIIIDSIKELKKSDLINLLTTKNLKVGADDFEEGIVKETIATIARIKNIQIKNGEEGCHRYIISNAEDIFSVLFVYGLLRWCGGFEGSIPVDIVPLFESMEGMSNSGAIMGELFDIPEYRKHLDERSGRQTIMLGFSDGTKDGGYLRANWSIFKAKENLSGVCEKRGVAAVFFDGRGGPPARGGGKTHRFYAARSNKIANNAIELTVQGQTITSKYGTKEHFIHNCEQLLTAGLSPGFMEEANAVSGEARELMDELSAISFEKYRILKDHEKFIPYLENKSTLKYYGETNIGSRPVKRGSKEKLELKDLRAIPFVGAWSQLKQNIPGYYGIGTALQTLVERGELMRLKKLFGEFPFFKALILNSMMSLSKCNFELTRYISKDRTYGEFWNILYEEYRLSKKMVILISDYAILMEEEPESRKSIEIREQIVLPLLVIQQYALQKIERNPDNKATYEKIIRRSLYGNINASRNSA